MRPAQLKYISCFLGKSPKGRVSINNKSHAFDCFAKDFEWCFMACAFTDFMEHNSCRNKDPGGVIFSFDAPACAIRMFYSCGSHEFLEMSIIIPIFSRKLCENMRNLSATNRNIVDGAKILEVFCTCHSKCKMKIQDRNHNVESNCALWTQ